jgi:DNA invertase Pin-like site-specific DNA recombinase
MAASICWVVADSGTQLFVFDSSALKKQLPIFFASRLSAEIERNMISHRTKEALARKKAGGTALGRPKGSLSKTTKLTGKEDTIREFISKKVPVSSIAKIMGVHRLTATNFIKSRQLGANVS